MYMLPDYIIYGIATYHFFTDVFGITWTITYSKKLHSLKIFAELFLIILGLILMEFFYLLRAAKPSLKRFVKMFFVLQQCLLH